jgi:hypothetical protein
VAHSAIDRSDLARQVSHHYLDKEQGGVARYRLLAGPFGGLGPAERVEFGRALGEDAARITAAELEILLTSGWRERRTVAWLIAVARGTEFRDRIGSLLLASEMPFAGEGYCVALTRFGTPADADLLVAYLDRYLPRPDLHYDQARVLGALLCLDTSLGTDRAARFLEPGGPWQRWRDSPLIRGFTIRTPEANQAFIGTCRDFAEESAELGRLGTR